MKNLKTFLYIMSFLSVNILDVQSSSPEQKNLIPLDSKDKTNLANEVKICENRMKTLDLLKNQVFPENKKLSKSQNQKKSGFEGIFSAYQEFLTKRKIELRIIDSKTPPKPLDSPDVVFRGKTSFDVEVNGYKDACRKNAQDLEAFLYWAWGKEPIGGFKKAYGIDNPDKVFKLYLK